MLSNQYNLSNIEPNIQVFNVDVVGDRSLTLQFIPNQRVPLAANYPEVLKHLHRLWGFTVKLEQLNSDGNRQILGMVPAE
jgi:spore cortex formation protein SpoVR/YcgB (stage V sporulation)